MRLNEFTQEEWFDVCRRVKPNLTWGEFEPMWAEFMAEKARRQLS